MNRSKMLWSGVIVLLSTATVVFPEDDIRIEVTTDFFTKYVWRGQNVTDDWVLQPGFSVSYRGLTGGIWGNLDLTDENGESGEFIEYDYYADYSAQITETIGFSVGGIYYYFPGSDATTELYWGFNFDVPGRPTITVYHDVDEIDGTYAALSVGHSFENPGDLPFGVDLAASLGWGDGSYNDGYWSTDTVEVGSELNDLTLSAAFPFEVAGVRVALILNYVTLLSDDIRRTDAYGTDSDFFFGGLSLSKTF